MDPNERAQGTVMVQVTFAKPGLYLWFKTSSKKSTLGVPSSLIFSLMPWLPVIATADVLDKLAKFGIKSSHELVCFL